MDQWIERKIMDQIIKSVDASDRSTHIFYITSVGGAGKTVLLRQIGMKQGSADGIAPCPPDWSGILDLYHSEINTSSGLETHLISAFETDAQEFQGYRDERDRFDTKRRSGLRGEEIETERAALDETFAGCMNKGITQWTKPVIAFDTTERIQYEVDDIQELCGLQDESTTVKTWLLNQLRLWENCVVLLVGRPEADPYLSQALEEALADAPNVHYQAITLRGFDEQEVEAYFELKKAAYPVLDELDADFRRRLWQATEGRPIRLDLAIEVIQHGLGFNSFRENVERQKNIQVRQQIDRMLIDHVMKSEPDRSVRDILRYLAVARKGLSASLLHHLAGEWDIAECQERLQAISTRGFVKQRPDDERLYLHDEMYQLCDTHLFKPDEVQRLSQRIAEWYDEQIGPPEVGTEDQNLQVDSLLYRLRADPEQGYHWYAKQAEYAIRAVQLGFDLRLRNEVVAFLKSSSLVDKRLLSHAPGLAEEFNRDAAARWVKRLTVRGENERAVTIAQQALDEYPGLRRAGSRPSDWARADLMVHQALAMIYSGQAQPAAELLEKAIASHEQDRNPKDVAPQEAERYAGWRRNLVLGRAHNHLGYAYWMYLGHYGAALREFLAAIVYFGASDLQEELANTSDNMGRVYALLRHPPRAAARVEEGLRIRRALERDYRVALSLNSRAIVHLEFGEFVDAQRLAQEALRMFENLNTRRGIGLALITLGRTSRHLGEAWTSGVYSYKECDRFLSEGVGHLDRAASIFEHDIKEPVRRVEALNELGSVYRERARLTQAMTPGSSSARGILLEAHRRLTGCIELAQELGLAVWYVDSCEDLAQVYFIRADYASTEAWLQRVRESVPDGYKVRKGQPLATIPERERVEAFWLQMGKVELLNGSLAFDKGMEGGSKPASHDVLEQTVRHYILSVVYFGQYSARETGHQATFRQMDDRLNRCSPEGLKYLQEEALPAIAGDYGIDLSRPGRLFEDTIGLALQLDVL